MNEARPEGCASSDAQIRQRRRDAVDDVRQPWVRLFEARDRDAEALDRMLEQRLVLPLARGFVRGNLSVACNASRLLGVGLREAGDLALERRHQVEQLRAVLLLE